MSGSASLDMLREIFGGDLIVIHKAAVRAFGWNAALVLREFAYWSARSPDGWVYRTEAEVEEACFVSPKSFRAVRRDLLELGVLQERREGLPARMFYLVDWEKLQQKFLANSGITSPALLPDLPGNSAGLTLYSKEKKQGLSLPSHEGSGASASLSPEGGISEGMEVVGLHMGSAPEKEAHARGLSKGAETKAKIQAERRRWFDDWFGKVYPRQEGQEDAWSEFRKLGSQITPEFMDALVAATLAWRASEQWQESDGRFIPYAQKFIRNRMWATPPKQARHLMEVDPGV